MGLGIYIKGELKNKKSLIDKALLSANIRQYFTETASGLFARFLSFTDEEDQLSVVLHPCEEPVEFTWYDTCVTCSAKTNSVGPGYHAYLVECIVKMEDAIGVTWDWGLGEEANDYQDESGYYKSRNFNQLQSEMLHWLKALGQTFNEEGGAKYLIGFPLGYPRLASDFFALSPLRQWTRAWFQAVASMETDQLHNAGKDFFIWWDKDPGAEFYKRTGIAIMNVECPWHFPADEKETTILSLIDTCFQEARKQDPLIELPEEDWVAVNHFLNEPEADIPETPYGYRKQVMTFDLAGQWMIDLPGDFYHFTEDATEVYNDSFRTVRSLSYSLAEKEGSDEAFAATFFADEISKGVEELTSATALAGKAIIYYHTDTNTEEEEAYWVLQGVKVMNGKFLLSTICYPDEEDRAWAIQTWNSIRKDSEEVTR